MKAGEVYETKSFGSILVLEYNGWDNVKVKFIDTGYETIAEAGNVRRGSVKDYLKPSVEGVGFSGNGKYSHKKDSEAYRTWQRMLVRCYNGDYIKRHPTYSDCYVVDGWHNFQNFAPWYYENYPKDGGEYHLDKDIKIEGNKVYSPESCMFVTPSENSIHSGKNKIVHIYRNKFTGELKKVLCFSDFAKEIGCKPNSITLTKRLGRSIKGWILLSNQIILMSEV